MILRSHALALTISALLYALPAQADAQVIEIGAGGDAAWVTGHRAGTSVNPQPVSAQPLSAVPGDVALVVPDRSLTSPHLAANGIPEIYAQHVEMLAARYGLSPALLEALVWQESRWRPNAVSPAGARGLAQLMPGTARDLGVDPDDPFANLEGGARYLRQQLDRFDGNLELALAAYNAGPERVVRSGGVPRIRETQLYVASIMGRLAYHSQDN